MVTNILLTGAAGYIGGTILQNFVARTNSSITDSKITAAVRNEEQVQALSKLGVNVAQLDLSDESDVMKIVLQNEIDLVVHTASSMVPEIPRNLIRALGQRRKTSSKDVFFIHSSITALYTPENGWPSGQFKDTDSIFNLEKQIEHPNPPLMTNIAVTEEAKTQGVTSFVIAVPTVYGRGTGQGRKLSAQIPAYIRTSIRHNIVHKFDVDGKPPSSHVADLAELYVIMVEKIVSGELLPHGEHGYYFADVHRVPWWDVMERLAKGLYSRGLVKEPHAQIWPSDDVAAEYLGFPRAFVRAMGTNSGDLVAINAYLLGWEPQWDQKRFLESIDDEIEAVLELDTVKPSIFDTLMSHPVT